MTTALAAVASVGMVGGTAASGAEVRDAGAGRGGKPVSVRPVTLVTGDRVELSTFADGKEGVTVRPGPGRDHVSFAYESHGDSVTVIPSDVLALLQRGSVDARLFDVKALIRMGYDDATRSALPMIVRFQGGEPGQRARSALGRTTAPKALLKSVNADAVAPRKADAAKVWKAMTRTTDGSPALAPGLSGIWLDGTVKAALDKSVPQIGAPAAWQDGLTGKDVLTAVLDTGIDATHPDLADAVAESKDFTGNPQGAVDGHGHGTHVASIITGNGSASGGSYAGVAPDTRLLVGKVLDNDGGGKESQIIAGMEWATSHGARVVNLSLGAGATDGTDPMSQAVNNLTASTGALFVIAAGNSGGTQDVSSPAAADTALAVGAVDADDHLAGFSSRGPRLGDYAVKPEITAPGVGIAAARAAGTDLGEAVGDKYTRLNGTSMATPHVAGAAALLAQLHPDWSADRLKATLTSTAKPTAGLGAFAQGSGRVDVSRAVRQSAYASTGAVSSYLKWPHTAAVTRTVTYRNDGDEPLTLDLTTDLDNTEAGNLVTLEAAQVTVPAHGTAEARLTINPAGVEPGTYSGMLAARSTDGSTVIRTALGIYNEPEMYDTTIQVTDRTGKASSHTGVGLLNVDTGQAFRPRAVGGALVARLPKGRYTAEALIYTFTNGELQNVTLASQPNLQVSADTSVSFDARDGNPVQATINKTATQAETRWVGVNQTVAGNLREFRDFTLDPTVEQYAVPTEQVTSRPYSFVHLATLTAPATPGHPEGSSYNLALTRDGHIPDNPDFHIDRDDLARVHVHYYTQGDASTGSRSTLAALDGNDRASGGFYNVSLPGKRTEYFTAVPGVEWASVLDTGTSFEVGSLTRYPGGKGTTEEWNKAAISPWAQTSRCGDFLFTPISAYSPSSAGHFASAYESVGQATLLRDGVEIGTHDYPDYAFFTGLPSTPARYTLRLNTHRTTTAVALATRIDTEWTFTSAQPEGDCEQPERAALLNARINADVDLNNSAPANQPLPLTINIERGNGTTPVVKNLTLEASFDDGATWQPVETHIDDASFSAVIPPTTSGNGYVALRTTVSDQDGNQLKQTVIRALRQH
ncbi:S8 family serine peptidase [Streptomyces wedmorensis]